MTDSNDHASDDGSLSRNDNGMPKVALDDIWIGDRARPINLAKVSELMASIAQIGLVSAITIRYKDPESSQPEPYVLVVGAHRYQAFKQFGYSEIPANIVKMSAAEARIAECDENLCRATVTPCERARLTALRKGAYEQMHPETKANVAGAHGANAAMGNANAKSAPAFAVATAEATGRSTRAVQLDAERGTNISPAVIAEIRGTPLDKGTVLDRLAKLSEAEQLEEIRELKLKQKSKPKPKRTPRISASVTAQAPVPIGNEFETIDEWVARIEQKWDHDDCLVACVSWFLEYSEVPETPETISQFFADPDLAPAIRELIDRFIYRLMEIW